MKSSVSYQRERIQDKIIIFKEGRNHFRAIEEATARFNRQLEEIEKKCSDSSKNPDELFKATREAVDEVCDACEKYEMAVGYNKQMIKNAQAEFRKNTEYFLSKSYLAKHARTWPQGYQGDYMMVESVYKNTPLSGGIGYYLDKQLLYATLSVAIRSRRETLRDILKKELENRSCPNVLDIACGSCREILEIAPDIKKANAKITCVDFDSDALKFSLDRLSYADLQAEQIEFRKYNALKMTNYERNLREFGMQDIIYSTGLFDYLDDKVLIPLLNSLYKLLSPGGTLIASFKDCQRYKTSDIHWLLAWDGFLQRTEEDMYNLFEKAEIPYKALNASRENSGVIIFFTAKK